MTERIPPGRLGGNHLGETRWVLEAARLRVDPVWRGRGGIPPGDGRTVALVPASFPQDRVHPTSVYSRGAGVVRCKPSSSPRRVR